jgi:hypothetical protein
MWPRVVEIMLGCWLLVTPFVFRSTPHVDDYTMNAAVCGAIVITASLLSFWDRLRLAHVVTLLVSLWLAAHGCFFAERPGPPAGQNELVSGLLLLLFAVLPNEINDVARPWREHIEEGGAADR